MILKTWKKTLVGAGLVLACIFSLQVMAAEAAAPKIIVDGNTVNFGKTAPRNLDGLLFAPIRPLTNALGVEMSWDSKAEMAIVKTNAGDKYVIFLMDSKTAVVNGSFVRLDATPRMMEGTAVAPVKVILQAMGSDYSFDNGVLTVTTAKASSVPAAAKPETIVITPEQEIVVPVVVEEKPVVTPETTSTSGAVVVATPAAVEIQPAKDVTAGNTDYSVAGIWEAVDKTVYSLLQTEFVVSGKITDKDGVIVGAGRGRLTGESLPLLQWQDGKETTINLRYDANTKKLVLLENGREIKRYDRIQTWSNTGLKSAMTFNGQWLDIWGNLITVNVPANVSSNQIVNGIFYEGSKAIAEKQIGKLKGSIKNGTFTGELIKMESGAEVKSSFTFSLMENGMFFKGMYAEPGKTEQKFSWDATRISF